MSASHRFLVVGNDQAGSRDRAEIERAAGRLATSGPVDLAWTSDADQLDEVLARLDGRRLVVAGGDGSVHAAVNSLDRVGSLDDAVVGILPFGTGNDLAGGTGMERLDDAVGACIGDHERRLDLLRTDDVVAVNALHVGIGADVASTASSWKRRLGPAAYPVAAVATGVRHRGFDADIVITGPDGGRTKLDGRFTMVAIANGWRIGGGFPLAPAASPDDGELVVVVVEELSLVGRARFAWAGRRGEHHGVDGISRHPGGRVVVETAGVGVNIDGEVTEWSQLDVRVDPGRLRLLVPPG